MSTFLEDLVTTPAQPSPTEAGAARQQPVASASPAPGVPQPALGPGPAPRSSRTLQAARMGLLALLLPGLALVITVIAAALTAQGTPPGTMTAISALAMAIATISTGGTLAHGARHWGAREPSSAVWSGGGMVPAGSAWAQSSWTDRRWSTNYPGGPGGGHRGGGYQDVAPIDGAP